MPCFAQTTLRDSGLFCHHRDVRKGSQRRPRKLDEGRLHRSSRPIRRMSEAVDDGPLLTVQNPVDMVGETVIDCRPSVLPVSIPLSALSPRTVDNAREISGFRPLQETGPSIMDMDTNEITIDRIVGFQWYGPGSPWAKSRYLTCQYHQRGPHFNGTNLFRYIYSKYFFLLDIPNW